MEKELRIKARAFVRRDGESRYSLAKKAKIHHSIVYRFLDGQSITLRTAEKIERAMR